MPGRKFLRVSAAIALGIGVSAIALVWVSLQRPSVNSEPFDTHKWRRNTDIYAATNDPGCVRGGMALDLIEKGSLVGKTHSEIFLLLGRPDRSENRVLTYELGQCSGFGWHNSLLIVGFEAGDKVSYARFTRDTP
ncbi:hypothetical protein [Crenobacter cavernae]|nr:hypothetical protein [Crenobacter cavernae]